MPKSSKERERLPKHLLIMRSSAMGDVAMLPHAIRALVKAYPGLKITVVTREIFRPFFDGLDVEFLFIDTKLKHKGIRGILRLAREARSLGVDAVADVHDVLRSQLFRLSMRLHGLKVRSIHKGRLAKWLRMGSNAACIKPLRHTVVRYCDVFRSLGFEIDNPAPAEKREHRNPMGEKQGLWIGVAPFSAQKGKIYPLALMREVIRGLSQRYDRVFIHSGKGDELAFAKEQETLYPNVSSVADRIGLKEEIDLVANLDCVVSMDSLVMHIASLTATPVVSVWGATHPKMGFLGYGCAKEGIVQRDDLRCRPCSVFGKKPCKFGDYRCLTGIPPEQIIDRVERLIARGQ